ncbi:MAG: DoxX family protein [Roseiflexaceae bacterium]
MKYQSIGITVLRIIVGIVFAAHGWQKLGNGVEGTAGFFGSLGVPLPAVAAVVVIALELLGGIALILGLGTRYVAPLLAFTMLVAMLLVHLPNGFFAQQGGVEFVLTLFGASVALALTGSGAYALDDLVFRRGRAQEPAAVRG